MLTNIVLIIIFIIQFVEMSDRPIIRQITKPVDHAEGPFWDYRKNLLYFVDIHKGRLYSYDFETAKLHYLSINGEVSVVIPSRSYPELLLLGVNRTLFAVEWDGAYLVGKYRNLITVSPQFPTSRFNDGKADNHGRIWIGTMGFEDNTGVTPNNGVLYRIDKKYKNPSVMIAPVNISNGLIWNKANDRFYYIDTPTRKIVEYHYNNFDGTISNPRTVFDSAQSQLEGFPDGMTIDIEDNLWVALYNGGSVIQINPQTSTLLKIIKVPAQHVTSVVWGGPKLDILFVTTSRFRLTPQQRLSQPLAGSVFILKNLGTRGLNLNFGDIINFA